MIPKADRPRCGAKTRAGGQCKAPVVWNSDLDRPRNGRCRLHGGMSTGPRTSQGRLKCQQALERFRAERKILTAQ
jgi:hypothetical protein